MRGREKTRDLLGAMEPEARKRRRKRELEARVANGGVPGLEGDASGAARLKRRQGGVP